MTLKKSGRKGFGYIFIKKLQHGRRDLSVGDHSCIPYKIRHPAISNSAGQGINFLLVIRFHQQHIIQSHCFTGKTNDFGLH